jgi:carboxyl-terminal processing protease
MRKGGPLLNTKKNKEIFNKEIFKGMLIGLLLSVMLLGVVAFVPKYDTIHEKLGIIEAVIKENYRGEIDATKMEEGIYKGFVAAVGDPYTSYYTKEDYEKLKEQSSGVYSGIGVVMSIDQMDNSITVSEVFKGSPAEEAGMLPKDKIIGADGTPLTGDDFELAPKLIKGKEGSKVTVTIFRPSENKEYDLLITRKSITYPSVEHHMIEDIGYIQIKQFDAPTHRQFKEALTTILDENATGLIIDLRNNGGGLLDVTEEIVDEFIGEGIIVSVEDNKGEVDVTYATPEHTDIPVVILVNEKSASASEVLSGALKDHKRAVLVGKTTFGKGIVQSIAPFNDGSGIKITTAHYFTPSGVCIQGEGIEPDYTVEIEPHLMVKPKLTLEEDAQLKKAIELLNK